MSKGLEALETVKKLASAYAGDKYAETLTEDIEKELKALEILKKARKIEVYFFDNGKKHYRINFDRTREQEISKEKYNILKEVFCND